MHLLLMCPEKAQNSCSAFPASDALFGFIQDFEDVISFDFSESLKSCEHISGTVLIF